jgi:hypothetical protein
MQLIDLTVTKRTSGGRVDTPNKIFGFDVCDIVSPILRDNSDNYSYFTALMLKGTHANLAKVGYEVSEDLDAIVAKSDLLFKANVIRKKNKDISSIEYIFVASKISENLKESPIGGTIFNYVEDGESDTVEYEVTQTIAQIIAQTSLVIPNTLYPKTLFVSTVGNNTTAVKGDIHLPYATIDFALTQAVAGDTIEVYSGTYSSNLNLAKNGVNLHFHPNTTLNMFRSWESLTTTNQRITGNAVINCFANDQFVFNNGHMGTLEIECDERNIFGGSFFTCVGGYLTNAYFKCNVKRSNKNGLNTIVCFNGTCNISDNVTEFYSDLSANTWANYYFQGLTDNASKTIFDINISRFDNFKSSQYGLVHFNGLKENMKADINVDYLKGEATTNGYCRSVLSVLNSSGEINIKGRYDISDFAFYIQGNSNVFTTNESFVNMINNGAVTQYPYVSISGTLLGTSGRYFSKSKTFVDFTSGPVEGAINLGNPIVFGQTAGYDGDVALAPEHLIYMLSSNATEPVLFTSFAQPRITIHPGACHVCESNPSTQYSFKAAAASIYALSTSSHTGLISGINLVSGTTLIDTYGTAALVLPKTILF